MTVKKLFVLSEIDGEIVNSAISFYKGKSEFDEFLDKMQLLTIARESLTKTLKTKETK